jgi:hypothetical protein
LVVPAVMIDVVRDELRGLLACPSHSTRSRTSLDVALSHSTSTISSHRHQRKSA